jgi:ribosome biogenesis protein MAK21
MLKTGTLDDKISSICLLVKKDPKLTLKYIDLLLKMSKKKNRRHSEICINALKDLFLSNILSNKKLLNFIQSTQNKPNFTDEDILDFYIDDFIHKKYLEFIEVIEEIIRNDPLKNIKKKYMNTVLEMLARRPEREEKLMEVLVNKLGDPDVEICTHAIKLLKNLQVVRNFFSSFFTFFI